MARVSCSRSWNTDRLQLSALDRHEPDLLGKARLHFRSRIAKIHSFDLGRFVGLIGAFVVGSDGISAVATCDATMAAMKHSEQNEQHK